MEVLDSDEHSSLLQNGINNCRKSFKAQASGSGVIKKA